MQLRGLKICLLEPGPQGDPEEPPPPTPLLLEEAEVVFPGIEFPPPVAV